MGGYDVLGKQAYLEKTIRLPTHRRVRVRFTGHASDSWDNEYIILKANGKEVAKRRFSWTTAKKNVCGGGWKD